MGTQLCMCSAGKVLLDLLPNVLSKALSISVVFVLPGLSLKPGKIWRALISNSNSKLTCTTHPRHSCNC